MEGERARTYLKGKPCYGGLDLAAGVDINAWCQIFPNISTLTKEVWREKLKRSGLDTKEPDAWMDLPIHGVLWRFWIPERKVKEKADRVDYKRWADAGYVSISPGNSVDHDQVAADIIADDGDYRIVSTAFDARLANVSGIIKKLTDHGMKCNPFGQGIMSVSEPTKELQRLINNFQFEHFGNPVAAWMMGNTVIRKDPAGNIRLDKEKSTEKIDGIAAMVNATAEAMTLGWNVDGDDDALISSWG